METEAQSPTPETTPTVEPANAAPPAEVTPAPEPEKNNDPVLLSRHHDISTFASRDSSRYILGGIHYDAKGKFIEATDGRILIRVPVAPLRPEDGFPKTVAGHDVADDCIIPTEQFKQGLSIIPKKGSLAIMSYAKLTANGDQKAVIVASTISGEQAVTTKVIEGNFPNTEQVLPKNPAKFSIALAPHYLRMLADYADKHGHHKETGIKLEFDDELSPCRFSFRLADPRGDAVKAYGVLMPMRMS